MNSLFQEWRKIVGVVLGSFCFLSLFKTSFAILLQKSLKSFVHERIVSKVYSEKCRVHFAEDVKQVICFPHAEHPQREQERG